MAKNALGKGAAAVFSTDDIEIDELTTVGGLSKNKKGEADSLFEVEISKLKANPYQPRKEFADANNRYNCPIVISYAEVIKNNVEELKTNTNKKHFAFIPILNSLYFSLSIHKFPYTMYAFNKGFDVFLAQRFCKFFYLCPMQ